jgi:hypothetical protein
VLVRGAHGGTCPGSPSPAVPSSWHHQAVRPATESAGQGAQAHQPNPGTCRQHRSVTTRGPPASLAQSWTVLRFSRIVSRPVIVATKPPCVHPAAFWTFHWGGQATAHRSAASPSPAPSALFAEVTSRCCVRLSCQTCSPPGRSMNKSRSQSDPGLSLPTALMAARGRFRATPGGSHEGSGAPRARGRSRDAAPAPAPAPAPSSGGCCAGSMIPTSMMPTKPARVTMRRSGACGHRKRRVCSSLATAVLNWKDNLRTTASAGLHSSTPMKWSTDASAPPLRVASRHQGSGQHLGYDRTRGSTSPLPP